VRARRSALGLGWTRWAVLHQRRLRPDGERSKTPRNWRDMATAWSRTRSRPRCL